MKTRHILRIITIITFFCIIISPTFTKALVASYRTIQLPANFAVNNLQAQSLTHQSGKFLFVFYDVTNQLMNISVYSTAGSLEASRTQALNPVPNDSAHGLKTKITIVDLNSTHTGLAVVHCVNNDDLFFRWYTFGVNNYAFGVHQQRTLSVQDGLYTSSYISYGTHLGNWYFFVYSIHNTQNLFQYLYVIECTEAGGASKIISEHLALDTGTSQTMKPLVAQHPNDTEQFYVGFSYDVAPTQIEYWRFDVELDTAEHLASHPFTGRWNNTQYSQSVQVDSGVYVDGTDTYLYFTWLNPIMSGSQQQVQNIQHRLRFNVTIESAEFEAQNERLGTSYDPDLPADTRVCWAVQGNVSRTMLEFWQPSRIGSGAYEGWYVERQVHDWTNFAITNTTLVTSETSNDTVLWFDDHDKIYREGESQFQVIEDLDTNEIHVVYGLTPLIADYDITFTWSPVDNPLYQRTEYEYTITVTVNGAPYQPRVVNLEIDEVFMWAHATDINGVYEFDYTMGTAGVHEFEINVFDPDWVYYEEFDLSFLSVDEPADPSAGLLLPSTIVVVMQMIPVFVCVMVPTYTLGRVGGIGGYIMGLVIGVIVAIQASLLPPYVIYLVILTLALTFAYGMRGGGSD